MELSGFGVGLSIVMFGAALLIGGYVFGIFEDTMPCSDRTGYNSTDPSASTGSAKQCVNLNNNVWSGLSIAGIGVVIMGLVAIFAPLMRKD